MDTWKDYERDKRRMTRLSRLEARGLERAKAEALAAIPTVTEYGPDHVKRWCAFFVAAVVALCLVMGCEQEPLNPELSNALTLEPLPDSMPAVEVLVGPHSGGATYFPQVEKPKAKQRDTAPGGPVKVDNPPPTP